MHWRLHYIYMLDQPTQYTWPAAISDDALAQAGGYLSGDSPAVGEGVALFFDVFGGHALYHALERYWIAARYAYTPEKDVPDGLRLGVCCAFCRGKGKRSKRETCSAERVLLRTRSVEATFQFELERAAVLDSRRGPVLQGDFLRILPDVFATYQCVARCLIEAAGILLPIRAEDPAFEVLFDRPGVAIDPDVLLHGATNAREDALAQLFGTRVLTALFRVGELLVAAGA